MPSSAYSSASSASSPRTLARAALPRKPVCRRNCVPPASRQTENTVSKLPTSAIASVISWATGQSRAVTSARAPARVCSGSSVADSPSTASEDRR